MAASKSEGVDVLPARRCTQDNTATTLGSQFMDSELSADLRRLQKLAYHRLEASRDLVQQFRSLHTARRNQPEFLGRLYQWLFVPITLWPIDIDGLLRQVIKALKAGTRVQKKLLLLIDLLPPAPDEKARSATMEHEHAVQHGNYGSLSHAQHKFDAAEAKLARDPEFKASWHAIKGQFDVDKFRDHKQIIRRRLVAERNMREDWHFRWRSPDDRFRAVFDVFCQRWNLYGMRGDEPLLLKLSANLTPHGTMIFVPAYWSFDPKRDVKWKAITKLHKARGVSKQGAKLNANRAAKKREASRAKRLWTQATREGLKGEKRTVWVMRELKWDVRTDEHTLRRLLKSQS